LGDAADVEDGTGESLEDGLDGDSISDDSAADACIPTGPEICNDEDDDCDGRTDEQLWCEVLPFHDGCRWVSIWGSGHNDVWVAGAEVRPELRGILMRWDGEGWTDVSPEGWGAFGCVAGSATDDVWLFSVADVDPPAPYSAILHWDGLFWSSPWWWTPAEGVSSISSVGRDDAWAVGSYHSGLDIRPLAWRWSGSVWAPFDLPPGLDWTELVDVSATSASDVWAVDGSPLGLVLHWDGVSWSVLHPPLTTRQRSTGVWAAGPADVWVSGNQQILHWDGTSWETTTSSVPPYMEDVWGFSPNDVWIVGGEETTEGAILHWNGAEWGWSARGLLGAPRAVWGASPSEVWAAGEHGIIRRWRQ
jgi:hypothetical protein